MTNFSFMFYNRTLYSSIVIVITFISIPCQSFIHPTFGHTISSLPLLIATPPTPTPTSSSLRPSHPLRRQGRVLFHHPIDNSADLEIASETIDFDEEEMKTKLAWAKHTVLSIAASILQMPSDIITTPPMLDPNPPSTSNEKKIRQEINNLLAKARPNQLDGFEIPQEEIEFINKTNKSNDSYHDPATYGEITSLGGRQLFHYMDLTKSSNQPIHFIDLGSGNGNLVMQAYLEVQDLNKVQGIELSSMRHELAIKSWNQIKEEAKDIRIRSMKQRKNDIAAEKEENKDEGRENMLNLMQGDLFTMDISTASHIYVASLCFSQEMMNALSDKIITQGGRYLSHVATLKAFPATFEVQGGYTKEARYVEMTWTRPRGMGGIVYFYTKQ